MPATYREIGTFTATLPANGVADLVPPFDIADVKWFQFQFDTIASTAAADADVSVQWYTSLTKDDYP